MQKKISKEESRLTTDFVRFLQDLQELVRCMRVEMLCLKRDIKDGVPRKDLLAGSMSSYSHLGRSIQELDQKVLEKWTKYMEIGVKGGEWNIQDSRDPEFDWKEKEYDEFEKPIWHDTVEVA